MCSFGGGSGGGSSNFSFQNTSSTYTPNPEAQAANRQVLGMAENVASIPYQPYGGQMVAGFTPDQMQAFEATRQMQGISQPYINAATNLQGQAVNLADPRNFNQQTLSQYMNPYQQDVVNATMANLGQLQQQQQNQLSSQAIKQGAFGGDRTGIARAALSGQQNLANAQTLAQLQQQGYTQAMGQYNQQQAQAIQTAQNAAYGLGQLGGQAQNAALTGIQALLGTGAQQQGLAQQQLSNAYNQWQQERAYPYQQAAFYAGLVGGTAPNMGGTTNTVGFGSGQTQIQQPSGGGGAAGAISSLMSFLPAMFGASDEDDKTDIKYLGRDPDTGEKMYSYRYKGDPKSYPKVVGPMAQDIEEDEPERVAEIGGHKVVAGLGRLKPSEREHFDGGGSAGSSAGLGALMGNASSSPTSSYATPPGNLAQQSQIDPGMSQFLQGIYDPQTAYKAAQSKWVNQPQSLGDEQLSSEMFQFPKQLMQDGSDTYPFYAADGQPRQEGGRVERAEGGGFGSLFDLLKQGGAMGPYATAPDNYMSAAQQIGPGKLIPMAQDKARSITESAAESMQRHLASEKGGGGGGGGEGHAPKMPEFKPRKPQQPKETTKESAGSGGDLGSIEPTPSAETRSEPPVAASDPVMPAAPEGVGPGALEGAGADMPFDFGAVAPPIPETHLLNPGFNFHFADGGRAELAGGGVPAGGGRAVTGSGGGLGDIVLGSSPSWSDLAGFGELSAKNDAMSPESLWKGIWAKDPGEQKTPEEQGMPAMPGEEYYKTPQERLPGKLQSETQGKQNPGLDPFMAMMMGGKQGMNLGLATMINNQVQQQQASEQQKALQEKRAKMLAEPRPVEGYFSKIGNQNLNPRTGLYNLDYTGAYYGMPYQDGGRVGMLRGGVSVNRDGGSTYGGTKYSLPELYDIMRQAGASPREAAQMAAVAMGESSGHAAAHNPNRRTGDDSYGLWQINMLGKLGPERMRKYGLKSVNELANPLVNARIALDLLRHGGGLGNWGAFNKKTAPYRHAMAQVSQAFPQLAARPVGFAVDDRPNRAVEYRPEARPLAYKPDEGSPVVAKAEGFAPISEQRYSDPVIQKKLDEAPRFGVPNNAAPVTYANATPEQRAQMTREAEAQAAAQRNALASASRKPGFSLSDYVMPKAQAADLGVEPDQRFGEGKPIQPKAIPIIGKTGEGRYHVLDRKAFNPQLEYAPNVREIGDLTPEFGQATRQSLSGPHESQWGVGHMEEPTSFEFPFTTSPLGTDFSSPEEPVAAADRPAAQPKQAYWGDYRDVEANPIGDFIDELAGDVRRSAKPGTATTPMGKFQGQGGLGALFDLEGYLPGGVQEPRKEKQTADAGFDFGGLFDVFG